MAICCPSTTARTLAGASSGERPKRRAPGRVTVGDLGVEPRKHDLSVAKRPVLLRAHAKTLTSSTASVADSLACQRPVAETGQPHVVAGRCSEHVPRSFCVNARLLHQAEDGVARTRGDGDGPVAHKPNAYEAAWVVARPHHHFRGWQAMTLLQYGARRPITVDAGTISGSFEASAGAVASTAGVHHWLEESAIRFIPTRRRDRPARALQSTVTQETN